MSQLSLSIFDQTVADVRDMLPNESRADLDGYYTPRMHTQALVSWLDRVVLGGRVPARVLEPSVGGGAWVDAVREVLPGAHVTGCDLNGDAPGLARCDKAVRADFRGLSGSFDMVIGNPPYCGDLKGWIDRSRSLAPVVGYLLRSTFLGAAERLPWWRDSPPSEVVLVLPRPRWEGPGARSSSDTCDSVFVVWDRMAESIHPRLHWLDVREGL